jgi:AmpD protein
MRYDPDTGLIEGIPFIPSPNFDERPQGAAPEVLVVHAISLPPGQFGGEDVERFFCNQLDCATHSFYPEIEGLRVSAHLFIRRNGQVVQFVPLTKRAWHAGESECEGRDDVNSFSIGIELEGCDELPFEDAQYETLAQVAQLLFREFPRINGNRVYGHSEISPGRKTDPGPHFDWQRFRTTTA